MRDADAEAVELVRPDAVVAGAVGVLPADGALARRIVLAWRVAQGTALLHASRAHKRCAICATVGVLRAADSDICHTLRAIRGTDAAANIMEVFVALGVSHLAPLLTVAALVNLASATSVCVGLVAIGAIITESSVVRAVLPADGANS